MQWAINFWKVPKSQGFPSRGSDRLAEVGIPEVLTLQVKGVGSSSNSQLARVYQPTVLSQVTKQAVPPS